MSYRAPFYEVNIANRDAESGLGGREELGTVV